MVSMVENSPDVRYQKQISRLAREETMYDIIEKTNETVCNDVTSNIKLEGWPAAVAILGLGAMQLAKVLIEARAEKKEE